MKFFVHVGRKLGITGEFHNLGYELLWESKISKNLLQKLSGKSVISFHHIDLESYSREERRRNYALNFVFISYIGYFEALHQALKTIMTTRIIIQLLFSAMEIAYVRKEHRNEDENNLPTKWNIKLDD
ncbi:hypothetical protein AKJ16_DCAP21899 [Drosera capensis]